MPSLLDEAIKVGQELESSEARKRSLQSQIDQKEKELKARTQEAEQQGRAILQFAKDEAAKFLQEAERLRNTSLQKLTDVEKREAAVEWVKEEDARLKKAWLDLKREQQATTKAVSEGTATQELYTSKLQELKSWEDALVALEAKVKESGTPDGTEEKPKKKGK